MAVVRIDDELLKELKEIIKKEENKYRYSSVSSIINSIIYDKLRKEGKK
jgi:metal-responsive CopG/Arc/MetJ family transcriptional regulator